MAATLTEIRDGLAVRLATISGLRGFARIPDSIVTPCAVVGGPRSVTYHAAYRNAKADYEIPIRLYVGRAAEKAAQSHLDAYISPTGSSSVKTAIEADSTLGGKVDDTTVVAMDEYGNYTIGDIDYIGCQFVVTVMG